MGYYRLKITDVYLGIKLTEDGIRSAAHSGSINEEAYHVPHFFTVAAKKARTKIAKNNSMNIRNRLD